MGVFSRLKRIVQGNINALLDKAENKEKVMEQLIVDMQAGMAKAREDLTQTMVDEKKLAKALEAERAQADAWRAKAGTLLAANNEAAAKEALVRHKAAKEMVALKEKDLESLRLRIVQMKGLNEEFARKVEMAKVKKVEMTTRMRAAGQAASLASADVDGPRDIEAFREFQKFVDKIDEDETRAQVMREMSGAKLEDELLKAEVDKALDPADLELEKLKAEMGLNTKKLEDKSGGGGGTGTGTGEGQ
jgi:phage shock protein A